MDRPASDPYAIHEQLRLAARHGVRAATLLTYHRALIDTLVAPEQVAGEILNESVGARAIRAEEIIRAAIQHVGGPRGEALGIILDLEGRGNPLEERREAAARILKVA